MAGQSQFLPDQIKYRSTVFAFFSSVTICNGSSQVLKDGDKRTARAMYRDLPDDQQRIKNFAMEQSIFVL